ncbi:MAG: chromosomal replication initiator DnaA, partial [Alphaproteobacteria bacterium]|nr:chromosomal replication initiator DnaA [Alphaproteobacteria bacterium]
MPSQIPLPLATATAASRDNFVVTEGNAAAAAFVDSWPAWAVSAAALCGPESSGKTHLATSWARRSDAQIFDIREFRDDGMAAPGRTVLIDNLDLGRPEISDLALFSLLNRGETVLLAGREAPARWPVKLPDLVSRLGALLTLSLLPLDDDGLAQLALRLFADRQLAIPAAVISRMLVSLERSPAAIRDFVD